MGLWRRRRRKTEVREWGKTRRRWRKNNKKRRRKKREERERGEPEIAAPHRSVMGMHIFYAASLQTCHLKYKQIFQKKNESTAVL